VDVAKIGSDTELDPLLLLDGGIALSPLDIDSASHRVDDTAELGQQPVADVLDDAPSVFGDLRINYGAEVILELGVCSFLVQRRKPTVTSDIRRQDSCETSLYALVGQREAPANLSRAYHFAARGLTDGAASDSLHRPAQRVGG